MSENERGRIVAAQGPAQVSTQELADLLRSFEKSFSRQPPERVVVADDSDTALAAALVAAKLLIPLEARVSASQAATANGLVIAQLAAA
jgi:UDP-N-acetylglucosamine 2-epimerase